ncbi:cell wall macromolecule catabolic process [Spatholobus suberectus]|nr:cell wall macromolecule catabolic process [Spatholobus suberectus]
MAFNSKKAPISSSKAIADAASWCCACLVVSLILLCIFSDSSALEDQGNFRGSQVLSKPCDEIYVVREGETLHTISDKCGDPFIVEKNPHIHDPDDVFPGLVIKITPSVHS